MQEQMVRFPHSEQRRKLTNCLDQTRSQMWCFYQAAVLPLISASDADRDRVTED